MELSYCSALTPYMTIRQPFTLSDCVFLQLASSEDKYFRVFKHALAWDFLWDLL